MKDKAFDYLSYDKILSIDITEQIRRYGAEVIYAEDDGVLVKNEWMYFISTDSCVVCEKLIQLLGEDFLFTAHNGYEVETIRNHFPSVKKINMCYNAVFFGGIQPLPYDYKIKVLDAGWIDLVKRIYKTFGDEKYLLGRLNAGDIVGAFDNNGDIMGFCGHHDDGLIGMLEVLPEYRRRGVAKQLMVYLMNEDIRKGYIPYSQIHISNEESKSLHRALGFNLSSTPVYWNEI